MVRAHMIIPEDIVDEVDRLVGPRQRSRFVTEAIREKLARTRLIRAFDQAAGSLADVDIPGWETRESAVQWVRSLRREGDDPWSSDGEQ